MSGLTIREVRFLFVKLLKHHHCACRISQLFVFLFLGTTIWFLFLQRQKTKLTLIDETYDHYLCIIRSSICNHLRSSYGIVIQDLIDKVTKDLIPKRINYLKKIIDQCQGAQKKYLRKQKLERLALDVKRLQETTTELQRSIEYMTQVEEANNGMLWHVYTKKKKKLSKVLNLRAFKKNHCVLFFFF